MKKILLSTLICISGFAFAQDAKLDSLKTALSKQNDSKEKVNTLNELGKSYFQNIQNEEAINYVNKAIELSKKLKDKEGLARSYNSLGNMLRYQGDNQGALRNYTLALDLYQEFKDKEKIAGLISSIGIVYAEQGRVVDAANNFHEALKIFKELGNKNEISQSYNKLGVLYTRQKNYKAALENLQRAITMFEEQNNKGSIAMTLHNISIIYYDMKDFDKALENTYKALDIIKELGGDKFKEAVIYQHIGNVYADQKRSEEALDAQKKALQRYQDLNYVAGIGACYLNIGSIYHDLNDIKKAKEWFEKGLKFNKEGYDLTLKINFYRNLFVVESALKKYEDALKYHVLYKSYSDSLHNEENTIVLTQAKMNYEFEQKEALTKAEQEAKDALSREELAKEKSNRNLALGGVGVFVLLAGFTGFAYSQKRKDNQIIAREKQKSDDLLLNILPEEVAQELKEKGSSDAKYFDNVSIMFTDFKDFTKLSEKIPSKELIEELNYCFKTFDEIVARHGVEKIKTIGDSYMAVCGLPAQDGNHAQKMVKAALEIRDFIEEYKQKRQSEGKSFFEMRIGINSGEVVAGIVGIKKFAYDIWGDAVNTASRMESNGEIGKINISESTYNLVKDDFDFQYRGEIDTKGKGQIKMYFAEPKNT